MTLKRKFETTDKLQDWDSVPWKKAYRVVRNLRRRIFRATQENNYKRVRSLQKLMIRSISNTLLSVRKVNQINAGKKTTGIDKYLALTKDERILLSMKMAEHRKHWKPLPTKRIYIPKKNGKKRPLSIPTIIDRCLQNIHKNALEPEWEAKFESSSYGFRPGRSAHDAMQKIFRPIQGENAKKLWVVEADIKGCFDNISHEPLLAKLKGYPGKDMLVKWLKAGFIDHKEFHATPSGVPQGGIISPLLANIALDGLEKALGIKYIKNNSRGGFWQVAPNVKSIFIRYADDFVILTETKEEAIKVKATVHRELYKKGLKLNEEKTHLII